MRVRVIARRVLVFETSDVREDAGVAAKDRADLAAQATGNDSCTGRDMTRATLALAVALLALSPTDVAADGAQAVYIISALSSAVRVRLSAGSVLPCDASDDRVLVDAWLQPNTYMTIASDAPDLCFDHTSESFPEGEWQPAEHVRRPNVCRRGSCRALPAEPVEFFAQ